jgi:NAD(P)-dependent dehydrogenase (short-subunit alcohol dehydrogenase family)
MGRILVIGATGLIGAPVARRLLADGHQVRLLVRDTGRASQRLGDGFEYLEDPGGLFGFCYAASLSSRRARWLVRCRSSGVPVQYASSRSRLRAQAM